MYKNQVVVLGINRLKEDYFTSVARVTDVDGDRLELGDAWIHPKYDLIGSYQKVYIMGFANKEFIKSLNSLEVVKNGKEIFKIIFEGEKR